MTNAEKYQEVFGFPPDRGNCPTEDCIDCPCRQSKGDTTDFFFCGSAYDWWDEEYKGGAA